MNENIPEWVLRHETEIEAYYLWVNDGMPDGYDVKYWLMAEQNVYSKYGIKQEEK